MASFIQQLLDYSPSDLFKYEIIITHNRGCVEIITASFHTNV